MNQVQKYNARKKFQKAPTKKIKKKRNNKKLKQKEKIQSDDYA